jgi:hypothetical protein
MNVDFDAPDVPGVILWPNVCGLFMHSSGWNRANWLAVGFLPLGNLSHGTSQRYFLLTLKRAVR